MKADNKTNRESVGELEVLRARVAELETELGLIRTSFGKERIGEARFRGQRERGFNGAEGGRGEFVQANWIVGDGTDRKPSEAALRENEQQYRQLVERANDGIAVVQDGLVKYANPSIAKILGCEPNEPLNQPFSNYVHPDVLPTVVDRYAKRMLGETAPTVYETVLRHKQGRKIYVELNAGLINYRGKPADLVIVRDVTERRRMEESLKKAHRKLENRVAERTEELSKTNEKLMREIVQRERAERDLRFEKLKFETMAENSPLGLLMVGEDGAFQYVNRTFTELFGYDLTDLLNGKQWFQAPFPDAEYRQEMISAWVESCRLAKPGELRPKVGTVTCKDGSEKIVSFGPVELDTGDHIVTFRDITEQVRAEQQIKSSLKEKEVLLREIHHRVKNNLQVMSSLLKLQARHVKDSGYLRMFQEADHRVRTMALVYEKLCESRNFAQLNVRQYVVNLINYLLGACSVPEGRISLKVDVEDAALQIDEAVQLGFIITELFTNCIYHAFVNDGDGEVRISFSAIGDNSYRLIVADNGVGLPDQVDLKHPESIGLDLLRMFVDQLHGSVEVSRNNGTQFVITFSGVERRQRR